MAQRKEVVFRVQMHCRGCEEKMSRIIRHFEGVEEGVFINRDENEFVVRGSFDEERLKQRLMSKTKKEVVIVGAHFSAGTIHLLIIAVLLLIPLVFKLFK